jgi:hypothetical protein
LAIASQVTSEAGAEGAAAVRGSGAVRLGDGNTALDLSFGSNVAFLNISTPFFASDEITLLIPTGSNRKGRHLARATNRAGATSWEFIIARAFVPSGKRKPNGGNGICRAFDMPVWPVNRLANLFPRGSTQVSWSRVAVAKGIFLVFLRRKKGEVTTEKSKGAFFGKFLLNELPETSTINNK